MGSSFGDVICRMYILGGGWYHYSLYHLWFVWNKIERVVDQVDGCMYLL